MPLIKQARTIRNAMSAMALVAVCSLSACTSTSAPAPVVTTTGFNEETQARMPLPCVQQVKAQQQALTHASIGQYMSLANSASACIEGLTFAANHPDVALAMQFNAIAFVNYVKAGDMRLAQQSFDNFRQRFPKRDLFLPDFTSFVDTASVLLKHHSMSNHQLIAMNISPALLAEMQRKRTWSLQ